MRKKKIVLNGFICLIFLLIFSIFFLVAPSLEAKTITLRYASYNPPRGMGAQTAIWLMNEVTKRTNGKVKFQQYFAGSLLKARELLRGIQKGTADVGYIFVPYYPKELKLLTVAEPFLLGPVHPKEKAAFFWELYKKSPELKAELAKWNQKLVAIRVFGKHSVGGPVPLKSLADLKGRKVRCAGGYDAQHMSALGAKIVFLRGTEVYSAMQKGAIDANYTPVTSYYKYKLYEIGKHHHLLVIPQFIGSIGIITINLDTWKKLSPDIKKIISDVGKEYSKIEADKIIALEKEYKEKMKAKGCEIIEISKDEVKKWASICEEASKSKWLKRAQKEGVKGKELMERSSKLIKKYYD
ncbi:MAG: hypothetical protein DRG20_00070 [Deltaproteobacteria bacterium]|nr:TRAP transporter substrate-binding protein DctP [Deltaproteobacteria bacterium]RLA91865.1 MAG: hypothetical protein DRG20_00070 [Deltaproteobacteria bacterium]